ncbi:hypothetical protein RND81_07G064000 [Saponaria officinalis]|uniref:Uncharacterized protein n=1 Tax=Saponaria officinalis TaxID=3572 RepID=A0AAW1JN24_SAPOF
MDENKESSITDELVITIKNPSHISHQNPSTDIVKDETQSTVPESSSRSSEQNPLDFFGNLHIVVKPARLLKQAFEAICDPEFNPSGIGRIDLGEKCFTIVVLSPDNSLARLHLSDGDEIEVSCHETMATRMVNLREIFQNLSADDDDTIVLYHIQGMNKLSGYFGKYADHGFSTEFLQNTAVIPEFPSLPVLYLGVLKSDEFSALTEELMKNGKPQPVTVQIMRSSSRMTVGEQTITYNCSSLDEFSNGAGRENCE